MTAMFAQVGSTFVGPSVDWFDLTPLIVLAGGAVVLMLLGALVPIRWPKGTFAAITAAIGIAALVLTFILWHQVQDEGSTRLLGGAIVLDGPALFITVVICIGIVLTALFLEDYLEREGMASSEVYALVVTSALGGVVMAWASDLIVLFLGLEVLSLALYILAASHLRRIQSQEAGLKYFVLGGFSSAFFLYGIALTYGATGSTNMRQILTFLGTTPLEDKGLLFTGLALMLVGFAFKISAVPFHMWTPDVYDGSPTPISGFMASASKAAAFAALLRVVSIVFIDYREDWRPVIYALAVLSLVVGSVLAIVQTNVKRMLAYSSISHAGFILVGVEAMSSQPGLPNELVRTGYSAALFYLLAYAIIVLGSFGVVMLVARSGDGDTSLDAYKGLTHRRPLLAFTFTVLLLAQAGVPLTAGFVAKFDVILAAVDAKSYVLAVLAMLSAVIAAFLYLRIIVSMYMAEETSEELAAAKPIRIPATAAVGLALTLAFTVVVGFLPGLVLDFARDAAGTINL
jgi:NADH-quinone oxidoreductase subunit N